jgi:hypothetical protein
MKSQEKNSGPVDGVMVLLNLFKTSEAQGR